VNPFTVHKGKISGELTRTIENAKRDGVEVIEREAGSQSTGLIRHAERGRVQEYVIRLKPEHETIRLPVRFEILLNLRHSLEGKYATLVHELDICIADISEVLKRNGGRIDVVWDPLSVNLKQSLFVICYVPAWASQIHQRNIWPDMSGRTKTFLRSVQNV